MLIRENATRTAAKRLRKRWEVFVFKSYHLSIFCFVELLWKSYAGMIAGKLLTTLVSPLFPLTNFVLLVL